MEHHRKQVAVRLRRLGSHIQILRKSGGTTNRFGKTTGESWQPVGTECGVLNTGRGGSTRQLTVSGGEIDQYTPDLTLVYDTAAQDGDRVEIEGVTYEIRTLTPYPTHKTASLVSVDGS